MTASSQLVEQLISYDWNDWAVSQREAQRVASVLRADPSIDATIGDLDAAGALVKLFARITDPAALRQVVAVLASRSTTASARARMRMLQMTPVNPVLTQTSNWSSFSAAEFFDLCHDLGAASLAKGFSARVAVALAPAAAPADPGVPFSGVGATGVNPTSHAIGLVDQALLASGHGATVARYSNPIPGSLPAYLAGLTPAQKQAQASTLVRQPISTLFPNAYRGDPPLRSRVMHAAGRAHDLEPELIAAAILAEQRDQSRNEDAKDYVGAVSLKQANTSIGLGQVVVSTAVRSDLFADLLGPAVRKALSHNGVAALLASDEFNIFATARYIRIVANAASRISIATLPNTRASFPAINMGAYGSHSSSWPLDNVRALASEYTSRAWDDRLSTGWANFVADAYSTFKTSGIAFP